MARNYWLQQLTVSSLLVTPIQSLHSSLPSSPLPSNRAASGVSRHFFTAPRPRTSLKQRYSFHLLSNGNEIEADDDISVGAETKGGDSPHFVEGETAVGIGGNDGFVYDVNALKRNLVQESVRGCKQELLLLLGDGRQHEAITKKSRDGKQQVVVPPRWRRDRDDLIEERLSALVQVCFSKILFHCIIAPQKFDVAILFLIHKGKPGFDYYRLQST